MDLHLPNGFSLILPCLGIFFFGSPLRVLEFFYSSTLSFSSLNQKQPLLFENGESYASSGHCAKVNGKDVSLRLSKDETEPLEK